MAMIPDDDDDRLAAYYAKPFRPGQIIWFFAFWIFVVCFLLRVI